jgi:PqqD family protein of HPr-rel-A system
VAHLWRAALALEQRELDGQTIAYCDFTGDTFQIAPLARAVLDALNASPADLEGLSTSAARALEADPAEIQPAVAETLEDLETLGIVERVSL